MPISPDPTVLQEGCLVGYVLHQNKELNIDIGFINSIDINKLSSDTADTMIYLNIT